MNKALTEKESKVADLFLEDLLTHEKTHAFKSVVNHFFEKDKISKERALFICEYLERKSLVTLILDSNFTLRNIKFDKSKIQEFLKNDGINKRWMVDSKLKYDLKFSKFKVKTFGFLFVISIFGGVYGFYDFIERVGIIKHFQSEQKKELEESKLHNSFLIQKDIDSLNTTKKSKKNE
ncbi:hypothetical protein N7U66_04610 [Lacinutrix neustonica]|uniref:Uncharacterized protein n=1 Tax=Lacinutrix neustonica TaxID=2980107 RepID=A0A9E8SDX9_9FLAO|nr:hypothetical protein [Lacinutrix neustonica]WAC02913.1 hypothetical protein N7U66_04610 [Lacinutrix neustonica]